MILGVFIGVSLAGCQPSLQSICTEQLPQFDQKLSRAVLALEPWTLDQPRRKLAALPNDLRKQREEVMDGAENRDVLMGRAERQSWLDWSVELLNETQHTLDVVTEEPARAPLAKDLHEVATLIVRFNGYAQLGDAKKMTALINQIQQKSRKLAQAGCQP